MIKFKENNSNTASFYCSMIYHPSISMRIEAEKIYKISKKLTNFERESENNSMFHPKHVYVAALCFNRL